MATLPSVTITGTAWQKVLDSGGHVELVKGSRAYVATTTTDTPPTDAIKGHPLLEGHNSIPNYLQIDSDEKVWVRADADEEIEVGLNDA